MSIPVNTHLSIIMQEPVDDEVGYETDEYFDEQGRKVVEIDYSKINITNPQALKHYVSLTCVPDTLIESSKPSKPKKKRRKYKSLKVPLNKIRYNMDDLTPSIRDPRCISNTDLAYFWPVYVGNFKDYDVSRYFASYGLHVRWWFKREDTYYRKFQNKARLYDMLVYFVSERDAELAVKQCHRDYHKGYTLNVFPGREPVYFKEDRSVFVKDMKRGRIYSEQFFERHVSSFCKVKVNCVVKFDMHNGALEFDNPDHVLKAQSREKWWQYFPVEGKLQKQRFLEKDVISQIEAILIQNPNTLKVNLNDNYLSMLLSGYRPSIDRCRKYRVIPLRRRLRRKTQKKRRLLKLIKKEGK